MSAGVKFHVGLLNKHKKNQSFHGIPNWQPYDRHLFFISMQTLSIRFQQTAQFWMTALFGLSKACLGFRWLMGVPKGCSSRSFMLHSGDKVEHQLARQACLWEVVLFISDVSVSLMWARVRSLSINVCIEWLIGEIHHPINVKILVPGSLVFLKKCTLVLARLWEIYALLDFYFSP